MSNNFRKTAVLKKKKKTQGAGQDFKWRDPKYTRNQPRIEATELALSSCSVTNITY